MLTIEQEGRIVWGMLRHDYGEGVGFGLALRIFISDEKLKELHAVYYYLEEEFSSSKEEDNYRFGSEDIFTQWYEFEKSLPDSPYFKGREALLS